MVIWRNGKFCTLDTSLIGQRMVTCVLLTGKLCWQWPGLTWKSSILETKKVIAQLYNSIPMNLFLPKRDTHQFLGKDAKSNLLPWCLRWLKTVSSTFQDVAFDGWLLPLFISWCYNHGKKLPNHWWTRWYYFRGTIGYHSNTTAC